MSIALAIAFASPASAEVSNAAAHRYIGCVVGQAAIKLLDLDYGVDANKNQKIAEAATAAAYKKCEPLYPKHAFPTEDEGIGDEAEEMLRRLYVFSNAKPEEVCVPTPLK
jgi:hypothetical protein